MKKLTAIVCMLFVLLSVTPISAQENECMEKGGTWDAAVEECVINGSLEIQITYPLELMQYDFVEQTVDEFLKTRRDEFLQFFSEGGFYPGVPAPWGLYIDYETYQFSENVISVNFTISDYTGGAHPNSYFQSFTFDLTSEQVITFEDLFIEGSNPLAAIYPIVQAELMEILGDAADVSWIETGTGENPANYQFFALTEDSLVFFFPPYQVAAYAAGPQQVEIPLSELSGILAPEFIK